MSRTNGLGQASSKPNSVLESLLKVDLSLEAYDKLFLKGGVKVSPKGKTWNYPFGSVYLRLTKSGKERWYIYYRTEGKRIRMAVKNAQSRLDALKVLQVAVADAFRGKYGFNKDEKRIKLVEFAVTYLENYARVSKKSAVTDEYMLRRLREFFRDYELQDITALEIEKFRVETLEKGLSKSTTNRYLALLKKMFNLAIDWGYLKENIVKKVKLFSERENLKERILTNEEEEKLLVSCF
jgi:integrase